MTIGNYEVPIWGKQGWLSPLEFDAAYDVDDMLPAIRGGLTVDGKLYAAPFYGESAMIMYRTDLFEKAGLTMPDEPDLGVHRATPPARSPTAPTTSTASACAARPAGARTWPS